jgi:CcmD family protein
VTKTRNGVRRWAMSLALVVLVAPAAPALAGSAQQPGAQTEAAREGYVPVKDLPAAEQLPAAPLVLGAYALIWVGVLAYVWTISRRLASVDRELVALRRMIDARR